MSEVAAPYKSNISLYRNHNPLSDETVEKTFQRYYLLLIKAAKLKLDVGASKKNNTTLCVFFAFNVRVFFYSLISRFVF